MTNDEVYEKLDPDAKISLDKNIARINKKLNLYYIYMSCALLLPILVCLLKPDSQSFPVWFQRSGAIMVVLSLLAELELTNVQKTAINQEFPFLYCNIFLKNKYEKILRFWNWATFFMICLGTVVWGYGDLWVPVK